MNADLLTDDLEKKCSSNESFAEENYSTLSNDCAEIIKLLKALRLSGCRKSWLKPLM